mmetsp:Transcript_83606/g.132146  ORF Transcript_83606/g.132146 Transcript_83606/m.132146 type:complete len:178 (+) Transcript_83606:115-648(+)|eukprot:CAMPEP_0169258982 /NCGR_PEP_ID=MMETSP1016-20121227/41726_1 /TAXON_ID=342587 /ORGANISM="Karlodinium micrum, Strain CCMP2283" /LENGTH=177 /DNA_ID=CAMNT_0009341001 /DNA_START=107 /DNA_END=640 /DNA_ORIENTATION=+
MIRFKPLRGFLGGFSLSTGVLAACLFSLIQAAVTLCMVSSSETLYLGRVAMGPRTQMALGSLSIVGVPLAILAGFGTIFRIEKEVWFFFYFSVLNFLNEAFWVSRLVLQGGMCAAMAPPEVLRNGPLFVCAVISSVGTFWLVVYLLIRLYLIAIVWSRAEMLDRGEHAELLSYDNKL